MSTFSWSFPESSSESIDQEVESDHFGIDIFFDGDYHVGPSGDYLLVRGFAALEQAVYHRLMTRPGEFKLRPNYGVGAFSYVKKRNRAAELDELKQRIIDQLSLEPRVDEVVAVAVEALEDDAPGIKISIAIRAVGTVLRFRPLSLTEVEASGGIA